MPEPVNPRRERAVRAAYKAEHSLYQLENAALAEIKAELEKARQATILILSTARKDWHIAQAKALLDQIKDAIKAWDAFTARAIGGRLDTVADIGAEQVTAALRAGARLAAVEWGASPMVSRAFVAVAQETIPLLITNVADETIIAIRRVLYQAVLAQESPFAAMQAIGTLSGKGPFASAFLRGEAILRTEYGRICQTANYSTLVDLSADNTGLRKEWSAVVDARTRPTHARADGQIRKPDEPFTVGGHAALYPHDPRLPAKESVHCRCISVPYDADWDGA